MEVKKNDDLPLTDGGKVIARDMIPDDFNEIVGVLTGPKKEEDGKVFLDEDGLIKDEEDEPVISDLCRYHRSVAVNKV